MKITPPGVRLAFAEQLEGVQPSFRTAVLLAFQDAIGLAKILGPALKNVEEALAAGIRAAGRACREGQQECGRDKGRPL